MTTVNLKLITEMMFVAILAFACSDSDEESMDTETSPTGSTMDTDTDVCDGRNMTSLLADSWTMERVTHHTFANGEPSAIEAEDLTDSDFEIAFTEAGRFIVTDDGETSEGDWAFSGEAFDFIMTFDDTSLGSSDVYIIRLTDDELWTLTVADTGDTIVETETRYSGTGANVEAIEGACDMRDLTTLISKNWGWDRVIRRTFTSGEPSAIEAQDVSESDFEVEYIEDGTFIVRNDGATMEGDWSFMSGNLDFTMTFDVTSWNITDVHHILRLTSDELWTLSVTDDGEGTIVETEVRHTTR